VPGRTAHRGSNPTLRHDAFEVEFANLLDLLGRAGESFGTQEPRPLHHLSEALSAFVQRRAREIASIEVQHVEGVAGLPCVWQNEVDPSR
jgi:hypothetical protein